MYNMYIHIVCMSVIHTPEGDLEARLLLRGHEDLLVQAVVAELVPELLGRAAEPDVEEATAPHVGQVPGLQQLIQLLILY